MWETLDSFITALINNWGHSKEKIIYYYVVYIKYIFTFESRIH